MGNFKIITDSSADLPEELVRERDIGVVPFYVMLDGGKYLRQGHEIDDDGFYDWMLKNPSLFPKSSAPSSQDFYQPFKAAVEAGQDVICICITTKFSSSYQAANIARQMILEEHPAARIAVIDSTVNTVLQGLFVEEACDLRDAGVPFDEAVERLEQVKPSGRIFFTIGGIEYLQMGGRIGKVAGKVSSVLNIRPVITLSEGEIHASGIARGRVKSLDKVLNVASEYLQKSFTAPGQFRMAVGYGYDYEEAQRFRSRVLPMITALGLAVELPIRRIGSVIGVHTGPHPLGVGILRRSTAV